MSPATQEPPEPSPPQQAPVTNVVESDIVPSHVSAENPPVEKKKEKKDKKEKREKKRKSEVIDDQTVAALVPSHEPPTKKVKAIDPASIPLPPSPLKPNIHAGKEKPVKKSKKDKYAAEKEKREKKRAMKLARAAREIEAGAKSNPEPTGGDVVMADGDAMKEKKSEKSKKSKKHKRTEGEDGEDRMTKKRKRELAADAEKTKEIIAPSHSDLTVEATDNAEPKKVKKVKKKDPDAMAVDSGVVEKKHKKSKKSKPSAIPELA